MKKIKYDYDTDYSIDRFIFNNKVILEVKDLPCSPCITDIINIDGRKYISVEIVLSPETFMQETYLEEYKDN